MPSGSHTFVIVGGGSAGCALANRLSADPDNRVLVLEAGRRDYRWDVFIHMPAALTYPIGSRFYDWKYESEPEPHMNGRRVYHARGKVLGGSSSINGMIFQRGNPMDYERWGATRDADVGLRPLPAVLQEDGGLPGRRPRRPVPRPRRPADPRARPGDQPAVPGVLRRDGAGRLPAHRPTSTASGRRASRPSTATCATAGAGRRRGPTCTRCCNRPNLELVTRAHVNRVLFDGNRASGVEYVHRRRTKVARAETVILCGGAINTPQLLQLSGIGKADELRALGIDVRQDLPGVGENLQDHLEVYIQYKCTQPVSMQKYMKHRYKLPIGAQWLFLRSGPGRDEPLRGRRLRAQQRRRGATRT